MRRPLAISLALLLAACSGDGPDAPGGVSEGEARALDAAAEMLDERRLPAEAIPPEASQPAAPAEMTGDSAEPKRKDTSPAP